jgi:hypothetical protein
MHRTETRVAARPRVASAADAEAAEVLEAKLTMDLRNETLGSYLRQHRQRRTMSVPELSRATRIPLASLEAIEADRFD